MAATKNDSLRNKYLNEDRIRGGIWGAIIAAAVLLVGGSYKPGWQFDSTAEASVLEGQRSVLVRALAPVCAKQFRAQDDLTTQVAALKEISSYTRDTYLVEHDWVIPSGLSRSVDESVGSACADLLKDLIQ